MEIFNKENSFDSLLKNSFQTTLRSKGIDSEALLSHPLVTSLPKKLEEFSDYFDKKYNNPISKTDLKDITYDDLLKEFNSILSVSPSNLSFTLIFNSLNIILTYTLLENQLLETKKEKYILSKNSDSKKLEKYIITTTFYDTEGKQFEEPFSEEYIIDNIPYNDLITSYKDNNKEKKEEELSL